MGGYLGGLIAVALVAYLVLTRAPRADREAGRRILHYDARMRLVGWGLAALLAPLLVFSVSSLSGFQANRVLLALALAALSICIPLVLLLEVYRVRVEFDETAIYTFSPWRPSRTIPWSDVISSRYSEWLRWHVIRTKSHGDVRLSDLLSGLDEFLVDLNAKARANSAFETGRAKTDAPAQRGR